MKLKLNYEKILEEFNHNLIFKLRKHGSDKQYLSLWVPNDDFIKSFKSLYLSLKENRIKSFEIEVKKNLITSLSKKKIKQFFKDSNIIEKKNSFIISVKEMKLFHKKKTITDQVKETFPPKINYVYGSLSDNDCTDKIKSYFLEIYKNKYKDFQKKILVKQNGINKKKILIDNKNFEIKYTKKNTLICLTTNTKNNYLMGSIIIFNKLFVNRRIIEIGHYGFDEFIRYVLDSTNTKLNGITLPFNLGYEVFCIYKVCMKFLEIFKKYLDFLNKNNSKWILLKKNEREVFCKKKIIFFLKKNNLKNDLILFDYIEKDLNNEPVRIFINIKSDTLSYKKSDLIRKLEKFLKDNLFNGIQVFYQEKKDLNKIRRL